MSNKTLHLGKTLQGVTTGVAPEVGEIVVSGVHDAAVEAPKVVAFSEDQLRQMLRDLQVKNGTIPIDTTVDLPIGPTPAHLVADKSALPPVEDRASAPLQVPAARLGRFDINGIPVLASPVIPESNIDPRTGSFYTQIGHRPKTQISPTPSRRFDGR